MQAVINHRGELLVVQERKGPAARPGFWKIPTGLVDVGEDIGEAVAREVQEETGIQVGINDKIHSFMFSPNDSASLFSLHKRWM